MTLRHQQTFGRSRLIQLDVLRGVAILLVLSHHQVFDIAPKSGFFRVLCNTVSRMGWTGVDLFFVLSGFLIGSLLFNELRDRDNLDAVRFLIRRGFKIWPAYYVYLGIVGLMLAFRLPLTLEATGFPLKDSVWSVLKGFASNILNIQNYLPTLRPHTWSLAVEEHFYLALPFVLLLLIRRKRPGESAAEAVSAVPWIALGLFVVCTALRLRAGLDPKTDYGATHLRIDELFFGVLLAYGNCLKPGFTEFAGRHRGALLMAGLVLIGVVTSINLGESTMRIPLSVPPAILGYGAILMAMVTTPVGHGPLGKAMATLPARLVAEIGVYSYAIYLWHIDLAFGPLNWLCHTGAFGPLGLTRTWIIVSIVYVLVATTAGVVMTRFVEEPMLAVRDRLFPRRAPALTESEAAEGNVEFASPATVSV